MHCRRHITRQFADQFEYVKRIHERLENHIQSSSTSDSIIGDSAQAVAVEANVIEQYFASTLRKEEKRMRRDSVISRQSSVSQSRTPSPGPQIRAPRPPPYDPQPSQPNSNSFVSAPKKLKVKTIRNTVPVLNPPDPGSHGHVGTLHHMQEVPPYFHESDEISPISSGQRSTSSSPVSSLVSIEVPVIHDDGFSVTESTRRLKIPGKDTSRSPEHSEAPATRATSPADLMKTIVQEQLAKIHLHESSSNDSISAQVDMHEKPEIPQIHVSNSREYVSADEKDFKEQSTMKGKGYVAMPPFRNEDWKGIRRRLSHE